MKKILVIGLGSMGKRRIRLLQKIDPALEIIGIDAREDRRRELEKLAGIETCQNLEDAASLGCEAAFVCTSPLSHAGIIKWCLGHGMHVFTEINLVPDGYQENMRLAGEKNLVLFLSSTFLYRDEVIYIENKVRKAHSVLTYSYHVGQYLPDWHPWESYKDYFIGDDRTNGCREILAIELPWIERVFGNIVGISVKKGKKTKLKTAYDDSYLMLAEHEGGVTGALLVDVVSRKAVRNLEVFGEDLYLSWDGTPTGLKEYDIDSHREREIALYDDVDRIEGYSSFVIENAYEAEIRNFIETVDGTGHPKYTFDEDLTTLGWIDRIEKYV